MQSQDPEHSKRKWIMVAEIISGKDDQIFIKNDHL